MSLRSKLQMSHQYDTEGTGTSDLDFSKDYTVFASSPWPDTIKPTVPLASRVWHQEGVFYTDAAYIGIKDRLTASEFQKPVVSFTASANPIANGSAITFDATASAPYFGGKIVSYAWDLDGDGIYETSTGQTKTVATSYAPSHATAVVATVTGGDGTHNEVQSITLANAVGGTFTVTFTQGGSQTSGAIAWNAAASAVQAALVAMSNIGTGQVTVAGSAGGPYTCTFAGTLADTNVPQMTTTVTNLVEQIVPVGLQVTDDQGNTGTTSVSLSVSHG